MFFFYLQNLVFSSFFTAHNVNVNYPHFAICFGKEHQYLDEFEATQVRFVCYVLWPIWHFLRVLMRIWDQRLSTSLIPTLKGRLDFQLNVLVPLEFSINPTSPDRRLNFLHPFNRISGKKLLCGVVVCPEAVYKPSFWVFWLCGFCHF